MHDVLVVGAGPAGSHAARRCAELGLDVLMLDAATFPRDKACGGVVGEEAVRLVGRDVLSVVEREGRGNEIFFDWRPLAWIPSPHMYFFKRRKFDHCLVKKAVAAGAVLLEGRRVTRVAVEPDRVVVEANGERHEARLVIGADGTNSVVGRAVGLSHHDGTWKFASIKAEVDLPPDRMEALGVENPMPHQRTYFFSDLLGFAWVIPNEGSVNAGFGAMMRHAAGLRQRFYGFLAGLGVPPQDVRGAQIPYLPLPRVYGDRVLLTGDAGGFVNPWTGCGIDDGIRASERAARVARLAVDRGDFTASTLREFQRASRDHLRWIDRRGRWMKALDLLIPPGSKVPSFFRHLVRVGAAWA